MKGYLDSGDLGSLLFLLSTTAYSTYVPLVELTQADIVDIELAGAIGQRRLTAKTFVKRAAGLALVGAGVLALCSYYGFDIL